MKISEFFKKKQKEDTFDGKLNLYFTIADAKTVHSSDISKEVHTKRKYYYEAYIIPFCDNNIKYDTSNTVFQHVSLLLPVTFAGTKPIELEDYLNQKLHDVPGFPIKRTSLDHGNCYVVNLKNLTEWITDIHIEKRHIECIYCDETRYIIHCFDSNVDVDFYVAFTGDALDSAIRKYLCYPAW